jgi:superfamily II DNA/RNA helicase
VFQSLADPNWKTSLAAFHHTSLSFTKDSHLLIAVPGKLQDYDLERIFAKNRILCLDEADVLLSGHERAITKDILKMVQSRKLKVKKVFSSDQQVMEGDTFNSVAPRIILTAATLPSRGPSNVGNQVLRLFPHDSVLHLKTENTHKVLPMAELEFVKCSDLTEKYSRLVGDLDALAPTHGEDLPKVLIFANTVQTASAVSDFLDQTHSESSDGGSKWWQGKVGCFFKQPGVFNQQREAVLRDFRRGSVRVMVCSNLGSRGLDFPDCSAVLQFDFPENSEHFLHRAGRTARAGRSGVGKD